MTVDIKWSEWLELYAFESLVHLEHAPVQFRTQDFHFSSDMPFAPDKRLIYSNPTPTKCVDYIQQNKTSLCYG